jgi:hypothetical protein
MISHFNRTSLLYIVTFNSDERVLKWRTDRLNAVMIRINKSKRKKKHVSVGDLNMSSVSLCVPTVLFWTKNEKKLALSMMYDWNGISFQENFGIQRSLVWFIVFNATFIYISIILWTSVLLVEEIGVPGEKPPTWEPLRVSLLKQELLTLPEHLSLTPVFSGVRVARSLVLCSV